MALPSDLRHRPLDTIDRLWALAIIANVLAVLAWTSIDLSVWWFDGAPAQVVTGLFLAGLVAILVRPGHPRVYAAVGFLGVLWFVGRGLSFVELATTGSTNLRGPAASAAVSAGVGQAVTHASLCLISIFRVVYRQEQAAGDRAARYRRSQPKSSPRGEGDEGE